jgi:predicted dehydrogenase
LHGGVACATVEELLQTRPHVTVIATTHDALSSLAVQALDAGSHVLLEKPGGRSVDEIDVVSEAAGRAGRLVKVGFNHRFHPGIARAVAEATSGEHGDVMFLRCRYGQGGRLGYDREWRALPERSGGGELIDQGMHVLDLVHWLLGPLPLQSSLVRTSFWDMVVDDNAVLNLGDLDDHHAPWATMHVSCSEWKNEFAFEIYCRTAKLALTGLARSYGPQVLRIYRMRPEMGPPDLEEITYDAEDVSWAREWQHVRRRVLGETSDPLLGDLESARYALGTVSAAYARSGYPRIVHGRVETAREVRT